MKKFVERLHSFATGKKVLPTRPQDVVFEVNNKGELSGFKINAVFKDDHLDYLSLEHERLRDGCTLKNIGEPLKPISYDAVDSFAGFVLFMKNNYDLGANQVTKFKVGDILVGKGMGVFVGMITNIIDSNYRIYYEVDTGACGFKLHNYEVISKDFIEQYYVVGKTFMGEVGRFISDYGRRVPNWSFQLKPNSKFHSVLVETKHGSIVLNEGECKVSNVYKLLEEFVLGNY